MHSHLVISFPLAVYDGPGIETDFHRHSIMQICVSRHNTFYLSDRKSEREFSLALIAPGVSHKTLAGYDQLMVYIDTFALGFRLSKPLHEILEISPAVNREHLVKSIDEFKNTGNGPLLNFLISHLTPFFQPVDYRLRQLDKTLNNPDEETALRQFAKDTGISESRIRHIFSDEAGIPIRRYRLWRRLLTAIRTIGEGKSLTFAALDAGFSDSAHFSRTFRTLLGVTPKSLFSNSRIMVRIHDQVNLSRQLID